MTSFCPHSKKQEDAIFSDRPIVVCGTGIQWGKTRVGSITLKQAMHKYTDPGSGAEDPDQFLLLSPNYKTMTQSSLPPFLPPVAQHEERYAAEAEPAPEVRRERTAPDPGGNPTAEPCGAEVGQGVEELRGADDRDLVANEKFTHGVNLAGLATASGTVLPKASEARRSD